MLRVVQLVIVIWNYLKLVLIYGELPGRTPAPRVYWPHVYEMERAIYGHTFNHIGAPPDKLAPRAIATGMTSINEVRLRLGEAIPFNNIETQANGVIDHIKPLSGYLEPNRWYEAISKATSVTELNAINARARKEVEIILQTAQQEGRSGLTKTEDTWCGVLYEVVVRCNDKNKILVEKERYRRKVMALNE